MSRIFGVWYFVYYEYNDHENWCPCYDVEVPLKANSKEMAVVEAELLWKERLKRGTYQASDGKTYPRTPHVRLEISLQSEV